MSPYDLEVEIDNNRLTHWYFNFLTSVPDTLSDMRNKEEYIRTAFSDNIDGIAALA